MADRDLLNKPLPAIAPEGDKGTAPVPQLGKLGVMERAREVAREAEPRPGVKAGTDQAARTGPGSATLTTGTDGASAAQAPGTAKAKTAATDAAAPAKAFTAAYFNRDTAGIGAINQRARSMAALRGEEGATDLRRIVLPYAAGAEAPSPEKLDAALTRMDGGQALAPDLAALVQRQAAWTKRQGVTPEMIAARQQALAEQVALRKRALARMQALPPSHVEASPSLGQALAAAAEATGEAPDPEAEAEALIDATARRGAGLLSRLSKVLGAKR